MFRVPWGFGHLAVEKRTWLNALDVLSGGTNIRRGKETAGWKPALQWLPAADEVDDFVAIAWHNFCFTPFGARENFEIAFDGYATVLKTELAQQIDHRGIGSCGPRFSVDLNRGFHMFVFRVP